MQGEKEKRDRCKKKNFDRMWSTYSSEFKEWWRTATRDQRTQAINSGIDRKPGGALENHVDSQWRLQEQVNQERKKKNAIKSEAVIQEVAETMCGGPLKLRQAVARGAIVVRREGGVDLYAFPSAETKHQHHTSRNVTSAAETPLLEQQHEEIKA